MRNEIRNSLLSLLLLTIWITPVIAQDTEENEGVAIVVLMTPKDGQAKALGEAITNYHHYMADKEGSLRFSWFSVLSGPDTGSFIARSGNHDWADFDGAYDWQEDADEKFANEVTPHMQDSVIRYTVSEQDWGIWPESLDGYTLFSVTEWHVQPGKINAFRNALTRVDGILKEGGFPNHYSFSRVASGGNGYTLMLASPRKNFADMSPKDPSFFSIMSQAMGGDEAATQFLAEWGSTYATGQNMLVKFEPELSDYGQSD